jgi:metal transporter CNNM
MLRVGMGDSSESDSEPEVLSGQAEANKKRSQKQTASAEHEGLNGDVNADEKRGIRISFCECGWSWSKRTRRRHRGDLEVGDVGGTDHNAAAKEVKGHRPSFQLSALEQSMPADAVLAKEGANEVWSFFAANQTNAEAFLVLYSFCRVLILLLTRWASSRSKMCLKVGSWARDRHSDLTWSVELIGEEIYDEFDTQGAHANLSSYVPPRSPLPVSATTQHDGRGVNPTPQNDGSQSDMGIVVSGVEIRQRPATLAGGGGGAALVPMAFK